MRKISIVVAVWAFIASVPNTWAVYGGEDLEPVNSVDETGQDVGRCDDMGLLTYPEKAYKGHPAFLLVTDPRFKNSYEKLTSRAEAWVRKIDGPAPSNRLYTSQSGRKILIYSFCKMNACDSDSLYGAFDFAGQAHLVQIRTSNSSRNLGFDNPALLSAINCAKKFDSALRHKAAQSVGKTTK